MVSITKHIIGVIAISSFTLALISSASPPPRPPPKPIDYINGTFTFAKLADDIFTKPKLSRILKSSSKNLSIVLRVPAPGENVTEERRQKDSILYNTIEKEFAKAGFVVRDRALFAKVLDTETSDYTQIGQVTDTDLILELLGFTLNRTYKTRSYRDEVGNIQSAENDINFVGAAVEFKLVSVKENDMVGSYTFNYTPCTQGCLHRFSNSYKAKSTWNVQQDIPKDFFVNSAKQLIKELGGGF